MRIGRFRFAPRLLPTLLTLVLVPTMVSLGFWQVDRAAEKEWVRDLRQQNAARSPVVLSAAMRDAEAMLERAVKARGYLDLGHQLLLENQKHRGEAGYYVYTPLRLQGEGAAVLVNRGWVPQGLDRNRLPALPGDDGLVQIHGRVGQPPSVGLRLGLPAAGHESWPKRVHYVDLEWVGRQLGYELLPYTVYAAEDAGGPFTRDWSRIRSGELAMPPEKHMAYAVQWFALALTLAIIYLLLNLHRTERSMQS